ncbi:MAG: hypothetical protein ACR5LA_10650 [Wolbachia sp.]
MQKDWMPVSSTDRLFLCFCLSHFATLLNGQWRQLKERCYNPSCGLESSEKARKIG